MSEAVERRLRLLESAAVRRFGRPAVARHCAELKPQVRVGFALRASPVHEPTMRPLRRGRFSLVIISGRLAQRGQ